MSEAGEKSKSPEELGKQVLQDLKRGDLHRTLKRDLTDLYDFYLTGEERVALSKMGRVKRWLVLIWWLLRGLFLKLPPLRRLLLLLALLCLLFGSVGFTVGQNTRFGFDVAPVGVGLLLVILMLELKDKLLAKDELAVGRAVQLALMPGGCPQIPGWDAWFYTRPANDVGGDLVDCLEAAEGCWGLVLGDVSGKGLGAALLMAKLQSTLRAVATEHRDLAGLGSRVNRILCRDGLPGKFATLAYLEVQAESGRVRLLNAGHLPPLVRQEGRTTSLKPVAPPLGVLPEAVYQEQTVDVEPGGLLLVYSDGLTDAHDEAWRFFGEERLAALLPALDGLGAEAAGARILAAVDGFVGDERPFDDLSLVLLRRRPPGGGPPASAAGTPTPRG